MVPHRIDRRLVSVSLKVSAEVVVGVKFSGLCNLQEGKIKILEQLHFACLLLFTSKYISVSHLHWNTMN